MEETIGYEALFSPEEWAEVDFADLSDLQDWDSSDEGESRKHTVFVAYPPGQYEGNEERYELECDVCDYIGAADTREEAQPIAWLHEALVATFVGKSSVAR